MKNILLFILILTPLILSGQTKTAIYKGGYWGKWGNDSFIRVIPESDALGDITLTIYDSYCHPSDFNFRLKFNTNSAIKDEDGWYGVYGDIEYKSFQDSWEFGLNSKYSEKYKSNRAYFLFNEKFIKASKHKKASKRVLKGTINVFYEDRGRGFQWD